MLFSDVAFLLTFLPAVLAAHFVVVGLSGGHGGAPKSLAPANIVLLAASLAFLALSGGRELVAVLAAAVGLNYLLAGGIAARLRRVTREACALSFGSLLGFGATSSSLGWGGRLGATPWATIPSC